MSSSSCLTGGPSLSLSDRYLCNLGFHCPNNTDSHPPQFCPPTPECLVTRLQAVNNICAQPQGVYEPGICPPGSFCSEGGQAIEQCPKGHFCPLGTVEPFRCSRTSICPPGAEKEFYMDGFIVALVIDLLLVVFFVNPVKKMRQLAKLPLLNKLSRGNGKQEADNEMGGPTPPDTTESQVLEVETASNSNQQFTDEESLQRFIASVKRAVGSDDVGMSVGFNGMSLTLKSGKQILAPQYGEFKKGSLWGVMGPSGAGKSSFVNVIMGKTSSTAGDMYINKTPCNISKFRRLIGYVPQDDVLVPELTVRENILHAARVRLPRGWTDTECQSYVDTLLACLGLSHVRDNIVGDSIFSAISGGQRKRVSIGLELAACPMAIFLDEPTSGLDATAALSIMALLKTLSQLNVTIICIIHQPRPEILESLDGIHLLHAGRQVYSGEAAGIVSYFDRMGFRIPDHANVGDAVLDIVSGRSVAYNKPGKRVEIADFADHWTSENPITADFFPSEPSAESQAELAALSRTASGRGAFWLKQMQLCFIRAIKQQRYQTTSFVLEISVGTIAGLLIGLALYQLGGRHFQGIYLPPFELLSSAVTYTTVPLIGMLACLSIGMAASAPGVKCFGEEKQIYWREASAGHSRSAYYMGKVLSTIPRLAISAMHFTAFYCILATPLMEFWPMYLVNLMYFYCIYGLAAVVSMLVRREDGPLMAMIVCLIIGVFGGYGPPLYTVKEWHLEWFWRLCPGIWLTEAFYDQHLYRLAHLYDIQAAANWSGYVIKRFDVDVLLLLVIGTVYRGFAYAGLIFLDRSKQR